MARPRLTMDILEKKYEDITNSLNENKIFICQFEQGTCVFVDKSFNMIMYNPHNKGVTRAKINSEALFAMYNDVFISNPDYKFFAIETDGHGIKDVFASATDALMCLKNGKNYGGYRVRKLD